MVTEEDKKALRAMMKELTEESRQKARERGKAIGRKIDQTELCYKQYQPPQMVK